MYGIKCFRLLKTRRRKVEVLFSSVIRHILKVSKFLSVKKIIKLIGSKAGHILLDERYFLLIVSCLQSGCNFMKNFSSVLSVYK